MRLCKRIDECVQQQCIVEALTVMLTHFATYLYMSHCILSLCHTRSASDDAERQMIAKLKLKCGGQFTSKMEGMMNDLVSNCSMGFYLFIASSMSVPC